MARDSDRCPALQSSPGVCVPAPRLPDYGRLGPIVEQVCQEYGVTVESIRWGRHKRNQSALARITLLATTRMSMSKVEIAGILGVDRATLGKAARKFPFG